MFTSQFMYCAYSNILMFFSLCSFLADLRKGDDFMGRMFYPLQSLPLTREEKTFTLTSHSGKSKHGFIVLSMAIQGVKKNVCQEVN